MTPLCFAMRDDAVRLWAAARRVQKSEPERAEMLKSLAKSTAKEADELANKSAIRYKKFNCFPKGNVA
jgi:hypothetical protein